MIRVACCRASCEATGPLWNEPCLIPPFYPVGLVVGFAWARLTNAVKSSPSAKTLYTCYIPGGHISQVKGNAPASMSLVAIAIACECTVRVNFGSPNTLW